jgi:hypothetical protein
MGEEEGELGTGLDIGRQASNIFLKWKSGLGIYLSGSKGVLRGRCSLISLVFVNDGESKGTMLDNKIPVSSTAVITTWAYDISSMGMSTGVPRLGK